jgi:hypothetical protein
MRSTCQHSFAPAAPQLPEDASEPPMAGALSVPLLCPYVAVSPSAGSAGFTAANLLVTVHAPGRTQGDGSSEGAG